MSTIKAVALVGFYRGEPLIEPGQVIDLPEKEFAELQAMNKVARAPDEPTPAPEPEPVGKPKSKPAAGG